MENTQVLLNIVWTMVGAFLVYFMQARTDGISQPGLEWGFAFAPPPYRSEEHTSELQSH